MSAAVQASLRFEVSVSASRNIHTAPEAATAAWIACTTTARSPVIDRAAQRNSG